VSLERSKVLTHKNSILHAILPLLLALSPLKARFHPKP